MEYPEITVNTVEQWRADNDLPAATITEFSVVYAKNLVFEYLGYCTWNPENPNHVKAIEAAVAFTVSAWQASDIDPLTEGLKANVNTVSSASLLGGSFTNANPANMARRRTATTTSLSADSIRILTLAGIRLATPLVVG